MNLKNRLAKLETRQTGEAGAVVFHRNNNDEIISAQLPGAIGKLGREAGESEGAFCQRVYGKQVVKKPTEEMTDDELEVVVAADDENAAREKARDGRLRDNTLQKLAVSSGQDHQERDG
jgi:hypothetical protein